ncbi:MAG: hypothetical protein AB7U38_05340 [Hyphomicrobiales bacterium]
MRSLRIRFPAGHFRFLPALAALAILTGTASGPAYAAQGLPGLKLAAVVEPRGEEPAATGSVNPQETPSPKSELQIIGVRAELKATRTGAPAPAGGTAFATILLSNETQARSVEAVIELSAQGPEIRQIIGSADDGGDGSSSRVITVKNIKQKKPERITVELLLKEAESDSADRANRLRVTLRQPGGGLADTTEFTWKVVDCPGAYYGRLTELREASDEAIGELLKSVQKPDKERPGRWLFTPAASTVSAKCLRSERVHDRRTGRRYNRCVEFEQPDSGPDPEVMKLERDVIRFASPLVSRRTVDPELSVKRNTGWVSYKIGTDLRTYLSQPKSPALCTGVPSFIGYYQRKIGEVTKRIGLFQDKAEEARKVAHARVLMAREAAASSAGGHPGWGGASLSLAAPEPDAGLKQLAMAAAALTGDTALQDGVAASDSTFAALELFKAFFNGKEDAAMPKDISKAVTAALGAIEAADYIAAAAVPYSGIDRHIVGNLDAISRAYGEHCACAQ